VVSSPQPRNETTFDARHASEHVARPPTEPLALTIPGACRASGLGKTKIYELIESGALESTTVGRRRLVLYPSLKALING
jgi:excisionase family DNA binding protein